MATTPKVNAATQKIRDDRAAAKALGQRYIRAAEPPAQRDAAVSRTSSKVPVNAATQAVRDARSVSKAAGERYTRKAGGEASVNAATQEKRLARAVARAMTKAAVPVADPKVEIEEASQRGATDWQKASIAWWASNPTGGIDPSFDITNEDAKYKADPNVKYRDEDGSIGWRDIAKNTRAQVVKAIKAGKTIVVLPDGEMVAAHQSTLDMIDRNLAGPD